MSDEAGFIAEVADRARLSNDDARRLVEDFLHAIAGFVSPEAWELIADLTPLDVSLDPDEAEPDPEDREIEDFLLVMSDEEEVESPRAAEHARAVAETIRSRTGSDQLARLRSLVSNEDVLALFETTRGELTSSESPMGKRQR
ncbi:MAG: DUF2267 domain-containing protein [Acidimicrobiia bacterium]